MSLVLLRAAMMAVMLTAPFVLLAMATGKAGGLIWLMFPVVLFIPAVLGSVLLLGPFEAAVRKLGMNANIALPIFGAVLGAIVVALAFRTSKSGQAVDKLLSGDVRTIGAVVGIILAGAVIGGAWRVSLWAVKSLDWA